MSEQANQSRSEHSCEVIGCDDEAVQGFDVSPGWGANRDQQTRHYEVCQAHADELWPNVGERNAWGGGGRYLQRAEVERIKEAVGR